MTEPPEINIPFGELDRYAEKTLGSGTITAAIVSMHSKASGQLILHNPRHDKKAVAARLRLCADILDPTGAHEDLLEAAQLLETAESAHANCHECEGQEIPELCAVCFPLFDDARIKRRIAIAKATGATHV